MSRKFVRREGPKWVARGIVTEEQLSQIMNVYEDKKHGIGILPILGSILVGLGILSFIAANWQGIPHLVRFGLIVVALAGFYGIGERLYAKGEGKFGLAFIGMGLFTFGAGIFLTGQMFHLVATNVGSFITWGIVGALLTHVYRSRFLFLLSLVIFDVAQLYSIIHFDRFSYTAFIVMMLLLGLYWVKQRHTLLSVLLSTSILLHSLLMIIAHEITIAWFLVAPMLLYTSGDWFKQREDSYPLQSTALVAAFIVGLFVVSFGKMDSDWFYKEFFDVDRIYYGGTFLLLLALSVTAKLRRNNIFSAAEWILFVPYFFVKTGIDYSSLTVLIVFSLYVLWRGYEEQWRFKINLGTVLFLISAMVAYGKLTWGFMQKSMFFIIGGIILLSLSWILNRRKQRFFNKDEGGNRSDD